MDTHTLRETETVKLNKVNKRVRGKGRVTVYTLEEEQSDTFGVHWMQVDHFDSRGDAVNAFENYTN